MPLPLAFLPHPSLTSNINNLRMTGVFIMAPGIATGSRTLFALWM